MYYLLKMGIFQPAMWSFTRGYVPCYYIKNGHPLAATRFVVIFWPPIEFNPPCKMTLGWTPSRCLWNRKERQTEGDTHFLNTLPETNSLALKRGAPLEVWRFLLETSIFRGYVSFREGNFLASFWGGSKDLSRSVVFKPSKTKTVGMVWYGYIWLHGYMVAWLHGYLRKPRTTSQIVFFRPLSVEGNAGHVACGSLGHGLGIWNVTWVRKWGGTLLKEGEESEEDGD